MAPYDGDGDVSEEDVGRGMSEGMMKKKKVETDFLADVLEEAGMDYEEVLELCERERMMVDTADQNFLSSLDLAVHDKAVEKAEHKSHRQHHASHQDRHYHEQKPDNTRLSSHPSNRINSINNLLCASNTLLRLNSKASDAITTTRTSTADNWKAYQRVLKADRNHVKKVLAAGKRIVEREVQGCNGDGDGDADDEADDGRAGEYGDADRDAVAGFEGSGKGRGLGRRGNGDGNTELHKRLERMEKGVRKMVKGMDG